ncbi:MAG: hypothetical protein P8O70_18320 [SAR324 cluster bacterium]|nr:hypothetical protein [SAR324 cluster bacterium]
MMPRLRLTSEVLQTVEDAASRGLPDRQIGELLGVSRATICRHKVANEAFETAIKKAVLKESQKPAYPITND